MSIVRSDSDATIVRVPNELPPVEMPSYTNDDIEKYITAMKTADKPLFDAYEEYLARWDAIGDCKELIDWCSELAKKHHIVNIREVLLLKCIATFEGSEGEEDDDRFVEDFKKMTFLNKVIYGIAHEHNKLEAEEMKRLEARHEERIAGNINFE